MNNVPDLFLCKLPATLGRNLLLSERLLLVKSFLPVDVNKKIKSTLFVLQSIESHSSSIGALTALSTLGHLI